MTTATAVKPRNWRQGDVVLREVTALPPGATLRNDKGDVVLKHGSATGHSHKFKSNSGARVFQHGDTEYLEVTKKTASLVHEEHDTIKMPKGVYEIIQQREYRLKEVRAVID